MSTIRNRQLHNRHPELPDFRIPLHGHTSPADGGVLGLDVSGSSGGGGSSGGSGSAVAVTDGTTLVGAVSSLDFTSGATVTDLGGGVAGVAISAGITVQDEGTPLATLATTLNFTGAGVTASGTGATKTISIPGGATASDASLWRPLLASDGTIVTAGSGGEAVMAFGPA